MDVVGRQISEVEAVRQARLEAQQWRFQLERAQNELACKGTELAQLQARLGSALAGQAAQQAAGATAQAEELEAARLEADGYKLKLAATELELARQLDALQELQWRLDSVVAQLGLHQPASRQQLAQQAGLDEGAWLLGRVGELAAAQEEAAATRRQLAVTQAELERLRTAGAAQQQAHLQQAQHGLGGTVAYTFEGVRQVRQSNSAAAPHAPVTQHCWPPQQQQQPAHRASDQEQVSAVGRQLIDTLLQENQELRGRLAAAEEQSQRLERDLDAELLIKAQHGAASPQPYVAAAGSVPSTQWAASAAQLKQQLGTASPGAAGAPRRASSGREGELPRRLPRPAVSESMELLARQRLELRLEDKERQMGKLRGVIKELEDKLAEAFKRQADWAMKESSWREQEALDRRLAELDGERSQLAAKLEAAQAEVDAARREAAVQRRLAKRLQQRPAAADEGEASKQMVDLLQKRVKILEAQNIKLRLTRRTSQDGASVAAAPAAAGGSRQRSAAEPRGLTPQGSGEGLEGCSSGPGENRQPNAVEDGAGGEGAGPQVGGREASAARTHSFLEGNPVLEKWEADKRLQKRVEALQAKLKERSQQLAASHSAREQLGKQVQQLQAELAQARAAHQRQLARADTLASAPDHAGPAVPAAKVQELLRQLDEVQRRHDALERQVAALQQRALPPAQRSASCQAEAGAVDGQATPEAGSSVGSGSSSSHLPEGPSVEASAPTGSAPPASGPAAAQGRLYRASDYGGAAAAAREGLEAQLLEKDVRLFDLALERDQALAQASRLQQRLQSLFEHVSPAAAGGGSSGSAAAAATAATEGAAPRGKAGPGGGRRQPSAREQELVDTVALLRSALERTKKGLQSGVSNSKYMQVVDKAKQLKAQVGALEAQLADATKHKEELARLQQQLGQLHAANTALKDQARAARQRTADAVVAREGIMNAQVAQLERALQERDAQLEQVKGSLAQYGEEVRVLVEEGLHPAALVQELLELRPRLRELEEQNAGLQRELAAFDAQFFQELEQLKAEHELLHAQSQRYEAAIRDICGRTGEPLPPGVPS